MSGNQILLLVVFIALSLAWVVGQIARRRASWLEFRDKVHKTFIASGSAANKTHWLFKNRKFSIDGTIYKVKHFDIDGDYYILLGVCKHRPAQLIRGKLNN